MEKLPDILSLPRLRRLDQNPAVCSGVYALFLAPNAYLPLGEIENDGLLYIGKAEGATGFVGRCHFVGARTLNHSPRKSLVGLLRAELGLELEGRPPKKWGLSTGSERDLTDWMHKNLMVAYLEADDAAALEKRLYRHYAPPLNLNAPLATDQQRLVSRLRKVARHDALGSSKPAPMRTERQAKVRATRKFGDDTRLDTAPDIASRYGLTGLQFRNALRKKNFAWHSWNASWDVFRGTTEWRQMIAVAEEISGKNLGELD